MRCSQRHALPLTITLTCSTSPASLASSRHNSLPHHAPTELETLPEMRHSFLRRRRPLPLPHQQRHPRPLPQRNVYHLLFTLLPRPVRLVPMQPLPGPLLHRHRHQHNRPVPSRRPARRLLQRGLPPPPLPGAGRRPGGDATNAMASAGRRRPRAWRAAPTTSLAAVRTACA